MFAHQARVQRIVSRRFESGEKMKKIAKRYCMILQFGIEIVIRGYIMAENEEETNAQTEEKVRDPEDTVALIHRLNRVEGQIRGIRRMLENDSYCPDVLIQVSAATAAMNSFAKILLAKHLKTRVAEDLRAGNTETVDELLLTLNKMLK